MKLNFVFSLSTKMRTLGLGTATMALCLLPFAAQADSPTYIFDPLPTPLVLPPGNVETLPLNHMGSFFGDQFRIVDCSPDVTPSFPGAYRGR